MLVTILKNIFIVIIGYVLFLLLIWVWFYCFLMGITVQLW